MNFFPIILKAFLQQYFEYLKNALVFTIAFNLFLFGFTILFQFFVGNSSIFLSIFK
jgi:hypothetical protein